MEGTGPRPEGASPFRQPVFVGESITTLTETDVAADDPMPAITPALVGAVVAPTVSLLVAFGLLEDTQEQVVVAAVGAWLALLLTVWDFYTRGKRNARRAQEALARAMTRSGTPALPSIPSEPAAGA